MARLPLQLPATPKIIWQHALHGPGLGGIAATDQFVIIGDRDPGDQKDVFRCFLAEAGLPLWTVTHPAPGKLDYGNSPRATPLIHKQFAFLLGAMGDLHCVELLSGETVWRMNLRSRFGTTAELPWGFCGSPLIVDEKLIVAPGAPNASLVALRPSDGKLIWKTPGGGPSYGSLIAATLGGVKQVVGHDDKTIGGWDLQTGKRLWTIKPKFAGDFNVPTPVQVDKRLLITTENNGTRIYSFHSDGTIIRQPDASNDRLHPSMTTPVVVGDRLVCVDTRVYCLSLKQNLQPIWIGRDKALKDYSSLLHDNKRVLMTGVDELLLVDATKDTFQVISRWKLFYDGSELYSHPAIVGDRLFIRGENRLVCVSLTN